MQIYNDLYIKYPEHPSYNDSVLEAKTPLDIIINQLEVILFTNKGDVLGSPDLGLNMEYYLWKTNVNSEAIEEELNRQISKYCPELAGIGYETEVVFIRDEVNKRIVGLVAIDLPGTQIVAEFI